MAKAKVTPKKKAPAKKTPAPRPATPPPATPTTTTPRIKAPAYASARTVWMLTVAIFFTAFIAVWSLFFPDFADRIATAESKIASADSVLSTVQATAENNRGILQDGYISAAGDTMPAVTASVSRLLAAEQVLTRNLSSAMSRMNKFDSLATENQKDVKEASKKIASANSALHQVELNAIRAYAAALGDTSTVRAGAGWQAASSAKSAATADSCMLVFNRPAWESGITATNARLDSVHAAHRRTATSAITATMADSLAKAAVAALVKDLKEKSFTDKNTAARWK